jgi:hypothetical protein
MSRPYATDEQYERWFMTDCCRCGRRRNTAGSWPDGHVCRTCLDRAVRTRGVCPGCGADRALPGRRPSDGAAICTTCAGFSQSFACARCGFEDKLLAGRLCTRCTLADRLAGLLDDGTGRIRPELVPLAELLLTMDNPRSGLSWLDQRKGRTGGANDLLRRLGRGQIELTHEAFHTLEPWRASAHLRELLMACGVLPALDKQICLFERWLIGHLAGIPDPEHAQIVRRFATWEVLSRLRAGAETKPLPPGARRYAGDQVKHATSFLHWIDEHGLTLSTCHQSDIDAWYVEHNEYARTTVRAFLLWCTASKLTRSFRLPAAAIRQAAPLPPHQRVALLGRILTCRDLPLRSRVAAAIVLLYAQPLTRIVRLSIDDVIHDGDHVFLRLGEPPSPVPGPLAELLLDWTAHRSNMNTATNHGSRWLFPGRRAGQPMTPEALAALVNDLGIPTAAGRAAAIRQHVLEMPAPVVADALGYHQATTARLAAQAGGTWSHYAPGDHLRSPSGWHPHDEPTTLEQAGSPVHP